MCVSVLCIPLHLCSIWVVLDHEMTLGFQRNEAVSLSENNSTRLEPVSDCPQIIPQIALYLDSDVLVNRLDVFRGELGDTHGGNMLLALCEDGHDCSCQ